MSDLVDLPPIPVLVTDHVILPRERYEELLALETRARDKLAQLRDLVTPRELARIEHMRVLEWLLGIA